jgi:FkbM family methyltransferase
VEIHANSDNQVKEFRILTGPARGLVFSLPVVEKWQAASFSLRLNEIQVCKALESLCKPGSVCLDLGASVGYHTLPLSRLCGIDGKVIAFEPNPVSYLLLERNVQRNQLQNVSLQPYALSNRTGHMVFKSLGSIDGLGHLGNIMPKSGERSGQKEYVVQVTSVDEFVEKERLARVDVIKMDIEGAELMCLAGMKKTLQSKLPVIIVEFNGDQRIKEGTEFLAQFGYHCQAIDSNNFLARHLQRFK